MADTDDLFQSWLDDNQESVLGGVDVERMCRDMIRDVIDETIDDDEICKWAEQDIAKMVENAPTKIAKLEDQLQQAKAAHEVVEQRLKEVENELVNMRNDWYRMWQYMQLPWYQRLCAPKPTIALPLYCLDIPQRRKEEQMKQNAQQSAS